MSDIEFNYLKTKVSGEAKRAILPLTLSKENYRIAVDILKDRFDLLDNNERQNRSLGVLKQNINQTYLFLSFALNYLKMNCSS